MKDSEYKWNKYIGRRLQPIADDEWVTPTKPEFPCGRIIKVLEMSEEMKKAFLESPNWRQIPEYVDFLIELDKSHSIDILEYSPKKQTFMKRNSPGIIETPLDLRKYLIITLPKNEDIIEAELRGALINKGYQVMISAVFSNRVLKEGIYSLNDFSYIARGHLRPCLENEHGR
jgi:hypothetical protein